MAGTEKVEAAKQARGSFAEALADGYGVLQRLNGRDGLHRLRPPQPALSVV